MIRISAFAFAILVVVSFQSMADSIDTRQFGLISIGTTTADDIVRQFGAPDRILHGPTTLVRVRTPQGIELLPRTRETYVYEGSPQIMDTYLSFVDRVLVEKVKKQH